jgi:hypothetical protein
MKHLLKFGHWILPLLGLVLGYVYAYVFFHGLLEVWYLVGKPDENIVHTLGVKDARNLLVATETGNIFSFEFADGGEVSLTRPPLWEKEEHDSSDPVPRLEYYGADFFTLPPLFQVVQRYEMEYLYKVEGKGAVKFVLAEDGNLWMWNHQIAGLTGLVFYFAPVIGFLAGFVVSFFIKGIQWLRVNDRFSQSGVISSPPSANTHRWAAHFIRTKA